MEPETQVTSLVTALENATAMAKQLPSTTTATATTATATTATDAANIYAALHAAHRHLSLFLHTTQSPPQPSTDVISNDDGDEPMRIADEDHQLIDGAKEDDSKMIAIESMEERMKDFSIQNNKRLKRSLSSTSLAGGERRRWLDYEIESTRAQFEYDPHVNRLRALDLIYQFHC